MTVYRQPCTRGCMFQSSRMSNPANHICGEIHERRAVIFTVLKIVRWIGQTVLLVYSGLDRLGMLS
jgi:hypothetical protein